MRAIWDGMAGVIMGVLGAIPLPLVRAAIIAMLLGLAIWVFRLPADYVFKGSPVRSPWRDVRIWALIVIILEAIPYIIF